MPRSSQTSNNEFLPASLQVEIKDSGMLAFTIDGRLDSNTTGSVWRQAMDALGRAHPKKVVVDASDIDYCDGTGIGLLLELRRIQLKAGGDAEIRNLKGEYRQILDLFDPAEFKEPKISTTGLNLPEEWGQATYNLWKQFRDLIAFVGEICVSFKQIFLRPGLMRWKDAFFIAEVSGVNALPIITLISFLMGLILAFQSSIPMRQFGADIYVANLIGLSMLRELGPLMTAIVLAGRTGSSFAAELGTMKVNEEIDAMTTMGLEPIRFLVIPRVLAALTVTPLLTVFADLIGILGGMVVLLSLGYPLISYFNQILSAVTWIDFLGGLVKSFVFGMIVVGIGCFYGLKTKTGASAVGDSTTRSVVSSIILIVVADGLFSVIYFYLGI